MAERSFRNGEVAGSIPAVGLRYTGWMGNISTLDRIDGLRDRIAELWADGTTNKGIAETVFKEFAEIESEPVKQTIINWRQDEQVASKIHALMRDRTSRLIRKVDASIENVNWDDLTVKEKLEIRKAYAPLRDAFAGDEKPDATKIDEDLFGAAEDDPEFGEKVARIANESGD